MSDARRLKRYVVIGLSTVFTCIFLLLYYFLNGIDLPDPTGPWKVGRTAWEYIDESRPEVFSNNISKRDIVLTIYYPANIEEGQDPSPYAKGITAEVLSKVNGIPKFFIKTIRAGYYDDAKARFGDERFPVLLFSAGFAGQLPWYSSLLAEIVSYGYVVICISHPYTDLFTIYPDGRVAYMNEPGGFDLQFANTNPEKYYNRQVYELAINKILDIWSEDTFFVLHQLDDINRNNPILAGMLDISRVGIFGHSFGGSTAIDVMCKSEEIMAGINMEGAVLGAAISKGISQPILFIETPSMASRDFTFSGNMQRILASSKHAYIMFIEGAGHISFLTDVAFLKEKYGPIVRQDVGEINPDRSLSILSKTVIQFFDQELKGIPAELLSESKISVYSEMLLFPEVTIKEYLRNK